MVCVDDLQVSVGDFCGFGLASSRRFFDGAYSADIAMELASSVLNDPSRLEVPAPLV